jgi:hypothetical protein
VGVALIGARGGVTWHEQSPALSRPVDPAFVPDVVVGNAFDAQPLLPLASTGVLRWVWHSKFGAILIEVIEQEVFVNGQRVERHAS